MKSRRLAQLVVLCCLIAAVIWGIGRISRPGLPVEIACGKIITRPSVIIQFNAALILAPDGTVWGWGENNTGLLGPINQRGAWNTPRQLEVGSNWVALAAGTTFAIGIKTDGSLWGWSFNPYHGLAGRQSIGSYTNPPTPIAPGTNWTSVAAGSGHALALDSDGIVWSWGQNSFGQLGNSSTNWSTIPKPVGTNRNFTAIASTWFQSLALQSDGTLWQWGFAAYQSRQYEYETTPTRVNDGSNWLSIAATDTDFIARKRDGSLWVWGQRPVHLGGPDQTPPYPLSLGNDWVTAAESAHRLLALKDNGEIWSYGMAWTYGSSTMTGILTGISDGSSNRMILPDNPRSETKWAGFWHNRSTYFALAEDGTLWTWGIPFEGHSRPRQMLNEVLLAFRQRGIRLWAANPGRKQTFVPWPLIRFTTNSIAR